MPTKKTSPKKSKPLPSAPKKDRLKPLSLWPMTPEEAIAKYLKADPPKK